MLVEDDPMVAEFNKNYVESIQGFKVVYASNNAQEALTALQTLSIDLILLDIYMPSLSGLEFLKEIRQKGYPADVILVSAARDTATINEALRLGAIDFLIKPFEFERLKTSLLHYRERALPFRETRTLNQQELDSLIGEKKAEPDALVLLKGLDRHTLKRICESIATYQEYVFNSDEIARLSGISRVSAKKYLEFLTKSGAITMNITYGAVGRPVHRFERLPDFKDKIKRFL
jgi:CitB family two-component system response regulator MalR